VIRKAGDRRLVPINRDDPFDNSYRNLLAVERGALLDMELEVAMVRALRSNCLCDAIGGAADLARDLASMLTPE
jgi:hypothetical protein